MCCEHTFFETDYCTQICRICGLEQASAINPTEGYTSNVPLANGYSRHHRMYTLLKQLFDPRHYGSPSSEVIANTIKHGPFTHGFELLAWLAKLKVKHKQYQNAHYYFAISSPDYVIPPPPNADKVLSIEREFHTIEQRFRSRTHPYKSFFSYNWLLRKFLCIKDLKFYLQFVKTIKCKKRMKMYQTMWDFFTTANSAVTMPGVSQKTQIPPVVLLASVSKLHRGVPSFLGLLLKNHLHNSEVVT